MMPDEDPRDAEASYNAEPAEIPWAISCPFCWRTHDGTFIARCDACEGILRYALEDEEIAADRRAVESRAPWEPPEGACLICGAVCIGDLCPRHEKAVAVESKA